MNSFLALLLAVSLLLVQTPVDRPTLIKDALHSIFRISHPIQGDPDSSYSCTAFIVDAAKGLALTASHCVRGESEVFINDTIQVDVLKNNPEKDLGLLRIPVMMGPPLTFASNVRLGEDATAIGFGIGRLTTVVRHVAGFLDDSDDILFDGDYIHGMSGGPILNNAGQVIGIVQVTQDGIGIGSSPKQMKDFIKEK